MLGKITIEQGINFPGCPFDINFNFRLEWLRKNKNRKTG